MLIHVPGGFLAAQIFGQGYLNADLRTQHALEGMALALQDHSSLRYESPDVIRDVFLRSTRLALEVTARLREAVRERARPVVSPMAVSVPPPVSIPPVSLRPPISQPPTRLPLVMWRDRGLQPLLADWSANVAGLQAMIDRQPPGDVADPELLSAIYFFQVAQAAMRLAYFDELTGLRNRHELERLIPILEGNLGRKRGNAPADYFLMIDIDHFKRVNDTYGHDAGDIVLQKVAKALFQVREGDYVFRNGGEEFLVFLANVGEKGIHRIAQRIRRQISDLNIELPGRDEPLRVTVSVGAARFRVLTPEDLAQADLPSTPADRAIKEADMALYDAKQRGRNRVVYFGKK